MSENIYGFMNSIESKRTEAAALHDQLRKSLRLREYFSLSSEGVVSLRAISRRINGYHTLVECAVLHNGEVKHSVPFRTERDVKKLPDDISKILKEATRAKPRS